MKYKFLNWILKLFRRKAIIIMQDYVGLGNRLKQLASYHICYGLENVLVFWNTKGWMNEKFNNLFHIEQIKNIRIYNIPNSFWGVTSFPTRIEFKERGYWRLYIEPKEIPISFNIKRNELVFPSIDFRFEDIPAPIIMKYRHFFDKLKPSKVVQERINEAVICEKDICLHVRNSTENNDAANVPLITSFFEIIKKYPTNTHFFLSAMDAGISKQFYEMFGNQIIELPNKNYSSMIDAVADMYLLGVGKELIVSSGSTFSEVAWWLGGAKQKIIDVPISYRQGHN